MENRKVVFICAPYDAKDSIAHAKEIALVSHFRTLIEDMYHYKTYHIGEGTDLRIAVSEDITGIKVRNPKDDECTISITAKKNS